MQIPAVGGESGLTVNALSLALAGARQPNRGNRQRAAGHYGRYISTIGPLFWNVHPVWMNLQAKYDLAIAEDAAAASIKKEVRPRAAA